MRYYLLSSKFCNVKLNGVFLGNANGNLCVLPCNQNSFLLELIPRHSFKTLTTLIKNGVADNINVKIIDLYGDFLILPFFQAENYNRFEVCFDKLFESQNLRISVMIDGFFKLLIENEFGFFCEPLTLENAPVAVSTELKGNALSVLITQDEVALFFVFDVSDKPVNIFKDSARECKLNYGDFLLVKYPAFINVKSVEKLISVSPFSCKTTVFKKGDTANLPTPLIPYAFLQELQYGYDFNYYLSPELKDSANYIKDFLGNFFAFTPAQRFYNETKNETHIFLIDKRVKLLTVTLKDNLVCDLNLN